MESNETRQKQLPPSLSGQYIGSFAYTTIKDRLPVILTKVVDHLFRERNEIAAVFGEECRDSTKEVIGRLSKLRNEMQTSKIVLPLTSSGQDVSKWNDYRDRYMEIYGREPTWFEAPWLYVECYMYRRIREAFELSSFLCSYDPFQDQKQSSLVQSLEAVTSLASHLQEVLSAQQDSDGYAQNSLSQHLEQFLEVSLWGNKCDLSISSGQDNAQLVSPLSQLNLLRPNILVNNTTELLSILQSFCTNTNSKKHLDIVLDNAGFELFSDLCLADFLQSKGLVKTINFYVKTMPWFVSDTTYDDFIWVLRYLSSSANPVLSTLGRKWQHYIEDSTWVIVKERFWTLPYDFSEMKAIDPDLYSKLKRADLIIFKGDLNYRKIVGDRMWDSSTSFVTALQNFHPAPICCLRTLKCEVVVGLRPGQHQEIAEKCWNWMISGDYAVIQYTGHTD